MWPLLPHAATTWAPLIDRLPPLVLAEAVGIQLQAWGDTSGACFKRGVSECQAVKLTQLATVAGAENASQCFTASKDSKEAVTIASGGPEERGITSAANETSAHPGRASWPRSR